MFEAPKECLLLRAAGVAKGERFGLSSACKRDSCIHDATRISSDKGVTAEAVRRVNYFG